MANIVVLTRGFPPLQSYGGPSVSINNIVKEVKFHNFLIIANGYELNSNEVSQDVIPNTITQLADNSSVIFQSHNSLNNRQILNLIEQNFIPDIVYTNSFFDFRQLRLSQIISDYFNIPLLIAPRGELEEGAMNHKKNKLLVKKVYIEIFKKSYNKFRTYFQATNEKEFQNIHKMLNFDKDKIAILENIPTQYIGIQNSKPKKVKNKLNITFISRIQKKKNLLYVLNILKSISVKYQIKLDIYGPLENKDYWRECQEVIKILPKNIKVEYIGILEHDKVIDTLNKYDLFFFPTFSENFGHIIYEAISAECLILISDQTPWTDINESKSGRALSLSDEKGFTNYLEYVAELEDSEYQDLLQKQNIYLEDKLNINSIIDTYNLFFDSLSKEEF